MNKSREQLLVDKALEKAEGMYPGKPARSHQALAAQILAQWGAELRTGNPDDEHLADVHVRAAVQATQRLRKLDEVAA